MNRRVAITGLGIFNSLGPDVPTVWRRLLAGENGIRPITLFDASAYRCTVAAEVPYQDCGWSMLGRDAYDITPPLPDMDLRGCRRGLHVFLRCVSEAVEASGIAHCGLRPSDIGVAAGASVAFVDHDSAPAFYGNRSTDSKDVDPAKFLGSTRMHASSFAVRNGDLMAAIPAKVWGFSGPAWVNDTACSASGHALGAAFRMVREGRVKAMVAGGASALVSPISILYFAVLGALSRNADPDTASRPFDRGRDGFVMGEGGGAVVLEDFEHAQARGAKIYAELAGYGTTTCAVNLTDPSPDGSYEAEAIRLAILESGLHPEEFGYVAAHGTSTPKNDATETLAIKKAFGAHAKKLLVSSNKGQLGHTISGAAITNVILAVMAMEEGVVPPTMHLSNPDPQLDLDFVPNAPRQAQVTAAIANSFAFGGHSAVLALKSALNS